MVVRAAGALIRRISGPPGDSGRPRQVARPAWARTATGVGDEAPAEDRRLPGPQPGIGAQRAPRRSGEAALDLDELLVALRPPPEFGWHTAILADTRRSTPAPVAPRWVPW